MQPSGRSVNQEPPETLQMKIEHLEEQVRKHQAAKDRAEAMLKRGSSSDNQMNAGAAPYRRMRRRRHD
eukprot:5319160-Karenia_brevis.AAC.1